MKKMSILSLKEANGGKCEPGHCCGKYAASLGITKNYLTGKWTHKWLCPHGNRFYTYSWH